MSILNNFPKFIFLFLSLLWATINVYFLPFFPWTTGIARPWYMLHGYLPYKDFTWVRNPLDLFLLSRWYGFLGATQQSYQLFVFLFYALGISLVFYISYFLLSPRRPIIFFFYIIFLFPLFVNTEEGEIVMSALNILAFIVMYLFIQKRSFWKLFMVGLIGGLIYLSKQNSAINIFAFLLTLCVDNCLHKKTLLEWGKSFLILFAGIMLPITIVLLFFLLNNGLSDYLYYTVFFIFGPYSKLQPNLIKGDGLLIAASYIGIIFPFILFYKKIKIKLQLFILLISLTFFSMLSLLPSYLSYRALPTFPLVAIISGFTFSLIKFNKILTKTTLIVFFSFVIFFVLCGKFFNEYVTFINQNGFSPKQYIYDYGINEKKVIQWLKSNTGHGEKITVFANEIIYVESDRLPKHKYIEPFSYIMYPYEKTSGIFIKDPPGIVVYDESLGEVSFGIGEWPFTKYMKKYYAKEVQYDTLAIYRKKTKHD